MPYNQVVQKKVFRWPFLGIAFFILLALGCKTVRPWQRNYLNDDAMQLGNRPIEKFTNSVHTYREGASGGGKAKGSGGCGCN